LPDHCGQGEKALADAGADAGEGAAGVAFEVELSFEGVEDGLDDLAQWFEELLPGAGLLFGPGRPDQVDPELGRGPPARRPSAPVSAQATGIPWTVAIRCSLKPKK